MNTKEFTREEALETLKIAQVALTDKDMRSIIGEFLGIDDNKLSELLEVINQCMPPIETNTALAV